MANNTDQDIRANIETRLAELRQLMTGETVPLHFVKQDQVAAVIWELEALL